LIVIHAGVGEEAGGGAQGSDAIWSHRWNLGGLYPIEGTEYTDENGNTRPYYAYDYTIEPEDGAAGVFCHEFGHDLGAPDEYDTIYSSASSEPVAFWSLMSSGSWGGAIPGTEPTGISPYSRQLFQNIYGGRWQNQTVIDYSDLSNRGTKYTINSSAETGDVLRINLPDVEYKINTPTSGEYSYWGGKGSDGTPIQNSMTATVDLTTTTNPVLNFKTWYDIEEGWDFGTVQIRETGSEDWTVLPGNITTTDHNPSADILVGHGITGTSDGWVDGIFDLTAYAGKSIELKFEYETDSYTFGQGFYIDDITITDNDSVIFSDDAEILDKFTLDGFTQDKGVEYATNYYLVEWRNHSGVDTSLAHVNRLGTLISYDPGMVVWYVNEFYNDNHGANHPGGGYLSVIDADQKNSYWIFEDKTAAFTSNSYQMHDAAFSMKLGSKFVVDATETYGRKAIDNHRSIHRTFKDTNDYTNSEIPTLGTILPKLGLNIEIVKQNLNNSGATVKISVK
ncbi:MAG: immune inhibitor A domain-containing protein, partial [Clostridium sp.]